MGGVRGAANIQCYIGALQRGGSVTSLSFSAGPRAHWTWKYRQFTSIFLSKSWTGGRPSSCHPHIVIPTSGLVQAGLCGSVIKLACGSSSGSHPCPWSQPASLDKAGKMQALPADLGVPRLYVALQVSGFHFLTCNEDNPCHLFLSEIVSRTG